MSDSDITPFEPESTPDFGGPFRTVCEHFEFRMQDLKIDWSLKTLRFQCLGDHANMDVLIRVSESDHVLQFFVNLPFVVSNEKMRPLIAEFIARANYGLIVGSLEHDLNDGSLRYHVTHLMEDNTVGDKQIGRIFSTIMSTFDRYIPGLMQVIYGGATPADACFLCELEQHADEAEETPPLPAPPKSRKRSSRRGKTSGKRVRGGSAAPQDTPASAREDGEIRPPSSDEESEF